MKKQNPPKYKDIAFKDSSIERMKSYSKIGKKNPSIKKDIKKAPSSTDSLAVYMRNSDSRSIYKPIADAAERKHGTIDVSKFDVMKSRTTNVKKTRKNYNLDK
jgi:hypothetical protein